MAIDAVTGLPILGPTDIIDQIPLGSQIVPFEDLQATDRPNRVPYYPDDIIPTSALVTGQDSTGRARAGRMDTGRNLYTREAVFQSNGQPIADGKTAPVDVNLVGGGGGGSGGLDFSLYTLVHFANTYTNNSWGSLCSFGTASRLYRVQVAYLIDADNFTGGVSGGIDLRFGGTSGESGSLSDFLELPVVQYSSAGWPKQPPAFYAIDYPGGITLSNDAVGDDGQKWLWANTTAWWLQLFGTCWVL